LAFVRLKWVFWISPVSWELRSFALNEFDAPRYDRDVNGERLGDSFIDQYGLQSEFIWKWLGVLFIGGFYILFLISNAVLLSILPPRASIGTRISQKQRRLGAQGASHRGSAGAGATTEDTGAMNGGEAGAQKEKTDQDAAKEVAQKRDDQEEMSDSEESGSDEFDDAAEEQADHEAAKQHRSVASNKEAPRSSPAGSPREPDDAQTQQQRNKLGKSQVSFQDTQQTSSGPSRQKQLASAQSTKSFQLSSFDFTPVTIAWQNVEYTVQDQKKERKLLNSVSGFARPGEMTALMGSSGAGKTTLMDGQCLDCSICSLSRCASIGLTRFPRFFCAVIAGRKTVGRIEGDILVNGEPKNTATFQRLAGYCEQNDIHVGTATVREALRFSARMRLPKEVSREKREKFVDEVMQLVGLAKIADRLIGDESIGGLSTGELKLVTIAVELVANPSLIFLDEPVSRRSF
jgi:energy-coupling factor transporter ATP-binding protein EcfA2